MSRLDFERVYPHPRDQVWRALTEPALLARWLMPVEHFLPRVGCEFRFVTEPAPGFDGIVHCRILELEAPALLRFSWRGGPIDTVVSFRLTEVAGGTRLVFEQTGFEGFRQWLVRTMLRSGFGSMYRRKLPRLLDEEFGAARTERHEDPEACGGWLHRLRVGLLGLLTRN